MICSNNYIWLLIVLCLFFVSVCYTELPAEVSSSLQTGLTERIGSFSKELLYYAAQDQEEGTNLIISPITVWTALAVVAEGASGNTKKEIFRALRLSSKLAPEIRADYQKIIKLLTVGTDGVELQKFNVLFLDNENMPLKDFQNIAREYEMRLIATDFTKPQETANLINTAISKVTHNRIPSIIEGVDIENAHLILTSALYFKGEWKVPFNVSLTQRDKFYDSYGKEIGEVMMMNNRNYYPFTKMDSLQASIIEIPYGQSNRISMLIMMPEYGVTLPEMLLNFQNLTLGMVLDELKRAEEEFGEDEIDFYIPRFKIETNLNLISTLEQMNIIDVFSEQQAELPLISDIRTYVSKVIHKAEIEVTEEGTTASAVTTIEFANRIGAIRFDANRPFCYLIIEKVTNSIAFGGLYQTPSIY